jgi:hypothetical protein
VATDLYAPHLEHIRELRRVVHVYSRKRIDS